MKINPIELTDKDIKRIKKQWEFDVCIHDKIVNQPTMPGSVNMTIKQLIDFDNVEFNQSPVNETKVKSILLKPDTGLLHNNFWLFNPIVLAKSNEGGEISSIVSGRTRLAALLTLCDVVGADINTTEISVLRFEYDSEERLAKSIVAFNTNRTMPQSERERVVTSSKLDGGVPSSFNAQGLKTKSAVKRHFKQMCLTEFHEIVETDSDNTPDYSLYLTENNLYRVFGYLFDIIVDYLPETYKSLKSGYTETWESISWLIVESHSKGLFSKTESLGNVSRNRVYLESLAQTIFDTWRGISEENTEETEEDCSF